MGLVEAVGPILQLDFSLCPALLPSLSVPGCFLQEHTLINILHSKLGLRVCFLGYLTYNIFWMSELYLHVITY